MGIRVGAIGFGARLNGVMKHVQEQGNNLLELVTVYDPSEASVQMARDFAGGDVKVCDDYHQVTDDPDIDWVLIGSWNCFHAEQTIAAFKAGKNVFCEKPLATKLEDCIAMHEAQKASGKDFIMGFTLRFSPHYRKIKELLESGVIGDIVSMEFNETLDFNHGGFFHSDWRRKTENSGTALLEKCCHDIDLANWMVASRARRVASFGGCNFFRPENKHQIQRLGENKDGKPAFGTWPLADDKTVTAFTDDKDLVDNQVAIIEYYNAIRATFHMNHSTAISERRMYICGTEGTLRGDVLTGEIEVRRIGFDEERKEYKPLEEGGGHGGGDEILGKELADTMLNGTPPLSTLAAGMDSAITCFGIDEAMFTGQVVDMMPYWQASELDTPTDEVPRTFVPAPEYMKRVGSK